MSWSPEDDLDEHGRTPREILSASQCQCAGASNWPGHCPGPAACPCAGSAVSICNECGEEMEDGDCTYCAEARAEGEAFLAAHGMPF